MGNRVFVSCASRSTRHWTQSDLAKLLGVSRQMIDVLETERYHPSLPLAFAIAVQFERPMKASSDSRPNHSPVAFRSSRFLGGS
jgi:putative transcriptional regulator